MIADPARGSRPPSPVPGRRRAKEAPGPAGTSAPGGRRRARPLAARHPGRGGGGGGGASSRAPTRGGLQPPGACVPGPGPGPSEGQLSLPRSGGRGADGRGPISRRPGAPRNRRLPARHREPPALTLSQQAPSSTNSRQNSYSRESAPLPGPGARVRGPVRHARGGARRPLSAWALPSDTTAEAWEPRGSRESGPPPAGGQSGEWGSSRESGARRGRGGTEGFPLPARASRSCAVPRRRGGTDRRGGRRRRGGRGETIRGEEGGERWLPARGDGALAGSAGSAGEGNSRPPPPPPPPRRGRRLWGRPHASCCPRARHMRGLAGPGLPRASSRRVGARCGPRRRGLPCPARPGWAPPSWPALSAGRWGLRSAAGGLG